jgi:hypothetical protein
MCEWAFNVADHFQFHHQTVGVAMNMLDRFLDHAIGVDDDHVDSTTSAWMDRSTYRLAAMTCLYTAIKIMEPYALSVNTMASLSRDSYSAQQIVDMERTILLKNRWLLHPPTAQTFGRVIGQWLINIDDRYNNDNDGTFLDWINVQLDAAIYDYELCCCCNCGSNSNMCNTNPSIVALCAVQNAMEAMNVTSVEEQRVVTEYLASILICNADKNDDAIHTDHHDDCDEKKKETMVDSDDEDIASTFPINAVCCSHEIVAHPRGETVDDLVKYIRRRLFEGPTMASIRGMHPQNGHHHHHPSQNNSDGQKARDCNNKNNSKRTKSCITCDDVHNKPSKARSPITVAEETESATSAMMTTRTTISESVSVSGHVSRYVSFIDS